MNYNIMNVVYMTVFNADFISVTLGRLRPRLHIAIRHLLFNKAVLYGEKSTFSTGRSTRSPLQHELQTGRIRRCVNFRRPLLANFVLLTIVPPCGIAAWVLLCGLKKWKKFHVHGLHALMSVFSTNATHICLLRVVVVEPDRDGVDGE